MINLDSIYGDQLFKTGALIADRPIIKTFVSLAFDALLAYLIVVLFEIDTEYAVLKLVALFVTFGSGRFILG